MAGKEEPSRTAAIGGTRVARTRGDEPRQQRDQHADRQRDEHGALGDDRSRFRQTEAEGAEERAQLVSQHEAEAEAEERGDDPDDERLEDDRPQHLPT